MSDIEKSQIAFMDECARNGCNHQCNEGRDCDGYDIGMNEARIYVRSAAFTAAAIIVAVVFIRWLIA